jgi:adenylate cyclase
MIIEDAVRKAHCAVAGHDADTVLASFTSPSRAIECALAIQNSLRGSGPYARVRIGVNAGEPLTDAGELFGAAVQLSREVCSRGEPDSILVSASSVTLHGQSIEFIPRSPITLSNEESVRLYEVS